jgi:2-amino-4-hydroxy-6-hydroxymethyldihydropteridine diphosphokinase
MANLVSAVVAIGETERVVDLSRVYETAPLGSDGLVVDDQPPYLNCAVEVNTSLDAHALRARTNAIEVALGRERRERWHSRPIDIDLVLFGFERISTPGLVVPHPRMHERAFVVRPLLDIAPGLVVPGIGAIGPLLESLEWQGVREVASAAVFSGDVAVRTRRGTQERAG